MKPKVSIIVPVYNVERYLDRCIMSLIDQTLHDIEIILVDDCSQDGCPKMCDMYKMEDARVKVVHKSMNEGLGYARNTGLDMALGEYVMFVDSDDSIKKNTCEFFWNIVNQYHSDIVSGNFIIEKERGIWVEEQPYNGICVLENGKIREYCKNMIGCDPYVRKDRIYPVSSCLLFIRRQLINDNKIRFRSEREVASEDTLFKTELLLKSTNMVCTPFCFYYYYLNGGSLTHTFTPELWDRIIILRQYLLKLIGEDEGLIMSINRYVSSDYRSQILKLICSNYKGKLNYISTTLNSPVWDELKEFKPSYYPLYARVFHYLCLNKCSWFLYLYTAIIYNTKKIKKYIHIQQ